MKGDDGQLEIQFGFFFPSHFFFLFFWFSDSVEKIPSEVKPVSRRHAATGRSDGRFVAFFGFVSRFGQFFRLFGSFGNMNFVEDEAKEVLMWIFDEFVE